MCAGNFIRINKIGLELVFRGLQQECAHNSNEIRSFQPELVFCDIPGKLVQRGRQTQWFRRWFPSAALLNPIACRVLRVPGAPAGLGLFPPRRLALRFAASALTVSYTWIGPEPPAAMGAGSLPGIRHGQFIITTCLGSRRLSVQAAWVSFGK